MKKSSWTVCQGGGAASRHAGADTAAPAAAVGQGQDARPQDISEAALCPAGREEGVRGGWGRRGRGQAGAALVSVAPFGRPAGNEGCRTKNAWAGFSEEKHRSV